MIYDKKLTIEWVSLSKWADKTKGLSGLDHMAKVKAGELPEPPILRLIGFRHGEMEAGRVVFEIEPGEQHYNGVGLVHGGIASTLLDSAMGTAISTRLEVGQAPFTVQLNVHFVRPIFETCGVLRCEGKVVSLGRSTCSAEGRIFDLQGKLYAHGTTTCMIVQNSR